MDLIKQYQRQYKWRDWPTAYKLLPDLRGKTVLDLGCGIGQQAFDFARAGAKVFAIDSNPDLLAHAREQLALAVPEEKTKLEEGVSFNNLFLMTGAKKRAASADTNVNKLDVTFIQGDLNQLQDLNLPPADLIWSSFSLAYHSKPKQVMAQWLMHLKPGGAMAIIEVDDLLGHAPMDERARATIHAFYKHSLDKGAYDFTCGRKLRTLMLELGLDIALSQPLNDNELCFNGPAPSAIMDAWKNRLARMPALQAFCGEDYDAWRRRFIAALLDEGHRSLATVQMCCGRLPTVPLS